MSTAHNNKLFIFLLLIVLFVRVSAENLRWVEVKFRLLALPSIHLWAGDWDSPNSVLLSKLGNTWATLQGRF